MITKYTTYIMEGYRPVERMFTTKEEISAWFEKIRVSKTYYIINDDLTVTLKFAYFHLHEKHLTYLPVKFNDYQGTLYIQTNKLRNFDNFPDVINGALHINNNRFKTLKGLPIVKGKIFLDGNPFEDITDLPVDHLVKNIDDRRFGFKSIKRKVIDDYFEYYVDKDVRVIEILKDLISKEMKEKYSHIFNAKNFDLI